MNRKAHVRCEAGEKPEISSKAYLSLYLYATAVLIVRSGRFSASSPSAQQGLRPRLAY